MRNKNIEIIIDQKFKLNCRPESGLLNMHILIAYPYNLLSWRLIVALIKMNKTNGIKWINQI